MKVFISMPMKGKTEEQVREEMEGWKESFPFDNCEFIDSIIPDHDKRTPLENLGESIKLMDKADAVFFTKGWEEARGCKIERAIAEAYDIPIYE